MTTQTEATMTGNEAKAKAVKYAQMAAGWTAQGLNDEHVRNASVLAAISQAFAAIAQIEATEDQTKAISFASNGSRAY